MTLSKKNKIVLILVPVFLAILFFIFFSFVLFVNIQSDCTNNARNYASKGQDGLLRPDPEKYNNYIQTDTSFCRFFYKDTTKQSQPTAPRWQEIKTPADPLANATTTEFTIPTPSWALSEYTLSSSTQYVDNTEYFSLCEKNLIKKYTQQKSSHFVQVNLEDLTFKIPYADTEIGTNIKIRPYKNTKTLVKIEFGNWLYIAEGMPNDNSALYNCLPEPQYEYTLSVMPEEWFESAPIFSLKSTQEIINGKHITIVEDGGLYDTTYMFYLYNGYVYILSAYLGGTQEMREIISQVEPIK